MTSRACKDCGSVTRKVTAPGPRCATCHRENRKRTNEARHEAYVLKTYGLRAGEYGLLYLAQGSKCYICQRATGKARKLAVDHDHKTGNVRGLLCKPCNSMLAHARDDWQVFNRASWYLQAPPAIDIVGERKPDDQV